MMTDTQITRPAVSYHPEMTLRCSVRCAVATTFSVRFFPRYLLDTGDAKCSIPAILQHPQNTPLQYLFDTPTPLPPYRRDTHLIESQDDVGASGSTCGAKPSKRSEALAGLRVDRSKSDKSKSSNQKTASSENFGRRSRISEPKP